MITSHLCSVLDRYASRITVRMVWRMYKKWTRRIWRLCGPCLAIRHLTRIQTPARSASPTNRLGGTITMARTSMQTWICSARKSSPAHFVQWSSNTRVAVKQMAALLSNGSFQPWKCRTVWLKALFITQKWWWTWWIKRCKRHKHHKSIVKPLRSINLTKSGCRHASRSSLSKRCTSHSVSATMSHCSWEARIALQARDRSPSIQSKDSMGRR